MLMPQLTANISVKTFASFAGIAQKRAAHYVRRWVDEGAVVDFSGEYTSQLQPSSIASPRATPSSGHNN